MTDRGTFNRLVSLGTITQLVVVSDKNTADAPGGTNLLLNPFSAYVVNPAKVPNVQLNVDGAKAFVDFLTSADFQSSLAAYPTATNPAFFADARPQVTVDTKPAPTSTAGKTVTVSGSLANLLPGSSALSGAPVQLQLAPTLSSPQPVTLASTTTDAAGKFTFSTPLKGSGTLQVAVPQFGAFTATSVVAGPVAVSAAVTVGKPVVRRHRVTISGLAKPAGGTVVITGHRAGRSHFATLAKTTLKDGISRFRSSVTLKPGKWSLRVSYTDSGVSRGQSRVVRVSVR
jgi:hypothetical protein